MTKRNAVIALLSAMVGLMSGRAKTGEFGSGVISGNVSVFYPGPQSLTFNLDTFSEFTFTQGKDTIKLTPAEIMAALRGD